MGKKSARMRRSRRTRLKLRELGMYRLCVHRTPRHMYAQVITPSGGEVVVSASTLDPEVKSEVAKSGNQAAAEVVGRKIAERAKGSGIKRVGFDRSGFHYHGRVKALGDAARKAGLEF